MTAKVGRWACLVCMAVNWGLIPVDLYFGKPGLALLASALGAACALVASGWADVFKRQV